MDLPIVLWIDLTYHKSDVDLYMHSQQGFRIRVLRHGRYTMGGLSDERPNIFCFEFDQPDVGGLHLIEETRRRYPSIPAMMLTEQHSEALAVWALRSRVWNYLVKPITQMTFTRSIDEIVQVLHNDVRTPARKPTLPHQLIPPELRFSRDVGDRKNIQAAVAYVQSHYHEKISETIVAALCGLSPFRLCRSFKKALGITFRDFVVQHRIDESKRLLNNTNLAITDVAFNVGFSDAAYFSRMFKRYIGLTPSEYRTRLQEPPSAQAARATLTTSTVERNDARPLQTAIAVADAQTPQNWMKKNARGDWLT